MDKKIENWERDFEDFYCNEGDYIDRVGGITIWRKYIRNLVSEIRKEPKMCLRCHKEIKSAQDYLKDKLCV